MKIEILPGDAAVARRGSALIAAEAQVSIAARGRFLMAVSGGKNPWVMLRALADEKLPWDKVHLFQVDERVAPDGDPDRNFTHLQESFLAHAPLPTANVHRMQVTEGDLQEAAAAYARTLQQFAGTVPTLDLAHLGMGPDGHTASLVPGDPVLNIEDADVAITGIYQGRRRMTLTYPLLNRSRKILWLITGESKADPLLRMTEGDATIPAGRIRQSDALVLADPAAAARLPK